MAEVLPNGRRDTIQFFRTHLPVWSLDPAAIGLTSAQVAALSAMVFAADAALASAEAAREAARAATGHFHNEADAMRRFGADLIKTIKAFAATTDDSGVYAAAQIPAPAAATPTPPPPAPTRVAATLDPLGHVRLAWKARRGGGVQFIIQRRLTPLAGEPGPWTLVGLAAANSWTDTRLPPGSAAVSYLVTAANAAGNSEASNPAVLAFGTPGSTAPPAMSNAA